MSVVRCLCQVAQPLYKHREYSQLPRSVRAEPHPGWVGEVRSPWAHTVMLPMRHDSLHARLDMHIGG